LVTEVTRTNDGNTRTDGLMATIQASLNQLLTQNQKMAEKIEALERENLTIKQSTTQTQTHIEENKMKWVELNKEAEELFKRMVDVQDELQRDRVEESYLKENAAQLGNFAELTGLLGLEEPGTSDSEERTG